MKQKRSTARPKAKAAASRKARSSGDQSPESTEGALNGVDRAQLALMAILVRIAEPAVSLRKGLAKKEPRLDDIDAVRRVENFLQAVDFVLEEKAISRSFHTELKSIKAEQYRELHEKERIEQSVPQERAIKLITGEFNQPGRGKKYFQRFRRWLTEEDDLGPASYDLDKLARATWMYRRHRKHPKETLDEAYRSMRPKGRQVPKMSRQ